MLLYPIMDPLLIICIKYYWGFMYFIWRNNTIAFKSWFFEQVLAVAAANNLHHLLLNKLKPEERTVKEELLRFSYLRHRPIPSGRFQYFGSIYYFLYFALLLYVPLARHSVTFRQTRTDLVRFPFFGHSTFFYFWAVTYFILLKILLKCV